MNDGFGRTPDGHGDQPGRLKLAGLSPATDIKNGACLLNESARRANAAVDGTFASIKSSTQRIARIERQPSLPSIREHLIQRSDLETLGVRASQPD